MFMSRAFCSKIQKIKMAVKIDEEWIRQRVHLKHDNLGKMGIFVNDFLHYITYLVVVL